MPSRILCIDDDALFCQAMADVLRDAGYEARTSRTAGEGLRQLEDVDLAIVDLDLLGVSGDSVIAAINEVRSIPVILTSGAARQEGRALARACGARHFLPKPFDLDDLLSILRQLLGGAGRLEPTG